MAIKLYISGETPHGRGENLQGDAFYSVAEKPHGRIRASGQTRNTPTGVGKTKSSPLSRRQRGNTPTGVGKTEAKLNLDR